MSSFCTRGRRIESGPLSFRAKRGIWSRNTETDIKNRKNITERKNHISKQKSLTAGYCLKLDVAVPWPKKPGIWER